MSANEQWFHDVTEDVYYRVTKFEHRTKRIMEEWFCSNGDRWYLEPGVTRSTVLHSHILTPCDPTPGMLSK